MCVPRSVVRVAPNGIAFYCMEKFAPQATVRPTSPRCYLLQDVEDSTFLLSSSPINPIVSSSRALRRPSWCKKYFVYLFSMQSSVGRGGRQPVSFCEPLQQPAVGAEMQSTFTETECSFWFPTCAHPAIVALMSH